MDFFVETCSSARDALQILNQRTFDIIISDYIMPLMDGIGLLQEVRKNHGDIPYILFTGKGDESVVLRAIENEADYYLRKGNDPKTVFSDLAYTIRKVVEKVGTQKELKDSLKKLHHAEEIAGFGYWEFHPDEKIFRLSHGARSICGIDCEECSLEELLSSHKPACDQSISDLLSNVVETGEPLNVQYQITRKNEGSIVHVHTIAEYDPEKDVVFGVIHDITEQKIAQQALLESEEKFRSLVTYALEPILVLDMQGMILFANNAAANMVEMENVESCIGTNVMSFIAPTSHEAVMRDFMEVMQGHDAYIAEYDAITMKGRHITVESIGKVIHYEGKLADLLSLRDITGRKQIEQSLRKASRQINLMNSITRHDILNKVTIILGAIEIAEMECTDHHISNYFRTLETATTAIQKQIEFTRLYQDLGIHAPTWQYPASIIQELSVPEGVTLKVELKNVAVFADPMLDKVFHNLLDNSVRHGKGVSQIRVSGKCGPDGFTISWKDNGVGVSMAEKELIFERGHGTHTGLGLFLVREILALTGILISETGIEGSGARFEILVPNGVYADALPASGNS